MQKQKKWVGLDGKPTSDDMKTHWDENGFLDIRETEEEAESGQETSGVETDTDVLRSDQITEIGMKQAQFVPKSPADIRKMMERVETEYKQSLNE